MDILDERNQTGELFGIHLEVLKYLIYGKSFEWIKNKLHDKFRQSNYLDIVKRSGGLSFDNNDRLIGAYPVSPSETNYRVTIEGIGSGYAMCAIDSLGIAFTFNTKTEIKTIDYSTKVPLQIIVDPNHKSEPYPNLFVSYKKCESGDAAIVQCPEIHFYTSRDTIPSGLEVFSFQEALDHAKTVFSPEGLKTAFLKSFNSING